MTGMFSFSDIFQEALSGTKLCEQKTISIQEDYFPLAYILVFFPRGNVWKDIYI
jgi:hypothetical protein